MVILDFVALMVLAIAAKRNNWTVLSAACGTRAGVLAITTAGRPHTAHGRGCRVLLAGEY